MKPVGWPRASSAACSSWAAPAAPGAMVAVAVASALPTPTRLSLSLNRRRALAGKLRRPGMRVCFSTHAVLLVGGRKSCCRARERDTARLFEEGGDSRVRRDSFFRGRVANRCADTVKLARMCVLLRFVV